MINTPAGSFVMVENAQAGRPDRKRVTVGAQNLEYAEIKSGLQEGDKVLVISDQRSVNAPTAVTGTGPNAFRTLR